MAVIDRELDDAKAKGERLLTPGQKEKGKRQNGGGLVGWLNLESIGVLAAELRLSQGKRKKAKGKTDYAKAKAHRMVELGIDRSFGRRAFGSDPASYHSVRPAYPDWVFTTLVERCGLADGKALFEIGPGTGTATGRLLELGARPLIAIEPDPRLAAYLRKSHRGDAALQVMDSTFEEAALDESAFDLGVCATAFHWLEEDSALLKVARLLRPGGWWAMVWNVFGDSSRPDPFHEATKMLLEGPRGPSAGTRGVPFALDSAAGPCRGRL